MATKITSYIVKAFSLFIILAVFFLPLTTAFAQGSEGIVLVKDVFLSVQDVEDLPDEVTFALYNSETAATPIATQTFQKGEYAVDYDFSKLDGLTFGSVARFEVNFTNTLNINGDSDTSVKIYEIWTEMEIDGTVAGNREPVSNGTLAEFLWASGAPISTYLALTYEGDEDAITIIPGSSLGNYISYLVDGYSSGTIPPSLTALIEPTALTDPNNWYPSGNNIYYTTGNVGIGTTSPGNRLDVNGGTRNCLANFTSTDPRAYIKFTDSGGSAGIGTHLNGGFLFYANSMTIAPMVIANSGNVGIGTLAPGSALEVNASSSNQTSEFVSTDPTSYIKITDSTGSAAIGTNSSGALSLYTNNVGIEAMKLLGSGNVGIGTSNPTYELAVNGTIRCKELIVDTGWSDFVFEDSYRLPPLTEVEQFIQENKHLPGIPTEAEVKEKGVSVGNISSKLLQKVEELTLYVIDLKKENDSLKAQLTTIQEQLNNKHPN